MGWLVSLLMTTVAFGTVSCQLSFSRRRGKLPAGRKEAVDFNCPEDFGYYAHPTDCTQYYVCVFGGALQESCTAGLLYSHELQTCDWPRNVVCGQSQSQKGGISTVRITDPRTSPVTERLNPLLSFDRGFDNTIKSTVKNSRPRQSRLSEAQPISRQDQGFEAHFQVQESTSRTFSVSPSSQNPSLQGSGFPSPGSRFSITSPRPRLPSSTHSIVDPDYNAPSNASDYDYYYYDLYLDDYYDAVLPPTSSPPTTTRRPATPRPVPSRQEKPRPSSVVADTTVPQSSKIRRPLLKPKKASEIGSSPPRSFNDIWKYPPSRPKILYPQPAVGSKATKCDPSVCILPDCYCGGKDIPGGISPQQTPQIVLLTFDDSVNDLNKKLYQDLFERGRTNANGCPIGATFYVSHEWTDYTQVQNLYADGHEIASHSITHSFGEQFSTANWAKEISGQREILAAYGGVKMEDIRGMRAPFLAIGGNKMFKMLYDENFTYDSSMPVYENKPPSWPYTLDYKLFHDCMIPPCPTKSYPGVWQVPMVMWIDLNGGRCSMADACTTPGTAEGVYKMLIKNFERHYTTNRAPFGLYYHAAWFTTPHHKEGFIAFLDTITAMDDVWIITNWQALEWVRNPVPLSQASAFEPWKCNYSDRPGRCPSTKVCNAWHKGSVRYMKTCQQCPENYPWVGNTGVSSPLNKL